MTKRDTLIADLRAGWVTVPDLLQKTGWKSHTLRGLLSTLRTKDKLKVERDQVDGVTAYRIAEEQ